jgi:hypothetical protein
MPDSWPTTVETSTQTYESDYGNSAEITPTTWPAGVITIASQAPEPPGPGSS